MKITTKKPFIIALVGFFLLILLLNLLTPFAVDDYVYAFRFDNGERLSSVLDIFPSLEAHAKEMNGRLFPHFFVQLFTLMPRAVFSVLNALIYTAFILGLYLLCKRKKDYDTPLLCILEGSVFILTPAFGQSFLWMAGSINYLWCDTLLVYLLLPFANVIFRGKSRIRQSTSILMPVAALCFGNMSESVSAAGVGIMALCILYLALQHKKVQWWMICTTIMAAVGWVLLMTAPKNIENTMLSLGGTENKLLTNFDQAMAMFQQHGILLSVIFFVLLAFAIYSPQKEIPRIAFAIGVFLCALFCNFVMIGSHYYPERAFTGTLILQIISCALLLEDLPMSKAVTTALALCLVFCSALYGLDALRNNYDRYRIAQARANDMIVAQQQGETDVRTFGINGKTKYDAFYGIIELTNDPNQRLNVCYAKYYGLSSVTVNRME